MKRSIFISTLVIAIVLFSIPCFAYAETNPPTVIDGTDYSLIDKSSNENMNDGFSGGRDARPEDIKDSLFQSVIPNHSYKYSIPKTRTCFTYYAQEKKYSCGPACVRMALYYLTDTVYNESVIRIGCGTTFSGTYLRDMKNYINSEQTIHSYNTCFGASLSSMQSDLYNGLNYGGALPIIGVQESTANLWPFTLTSHTLAVYYITSDYSTFCVADPWAGYSNPNSSYKCYSVSSSMLYDAYSAKNIGYMY